VIDYPAILEMIEEMLDLIDGNRVARTRIHPPRFSNDHVR